MTPKPLCTSPEGIRSAELTRQIDAAQAEMLNQFHRKATAHAAMLKARREYRRLIKL